MRERADYIVPYFNDHYRFDKPPLTYWFQTLGYRVFGENDFAARFPSAVAAALTAVLLLVWGSRLSNERAGWWAAIIFTLCLQTFMHAKAAVADMWLVLFVIAAHWAGYELLFGESGNEGRTSNKVVEAPVLRRVAAEPLRTAATTTNRGESQVWWWIFYVALAFAFLAKGPIGWTPLLTIAAARFFLDNTELSKRFAFVRGLVLTAAIIAIWGIPALLRTDGEFFRIGIGRHVIARSIATMEGHGANSLAIYLLTLPFYFVTVFISFFPWSIKLPLLTRKLWRQRDAIDNYLITGAAVIFLVFTLVKTKLPHYTLPALPLLALLLARHWAGQGAAARSRTVFGVSKAPTAAESRRSQFKRIAIATACVYLAIALFVFPLAEKWFPSVQLFKASQNDLCPEMEFGAVSYNEPSLVWYFRSRVKGFLDSTLDAKSAEPFMDEPGARFVILPTSTAAKIYPTLPEGWKSFRTQGINIAKGKRVDLTLVLKP
jgi:4-amino-4-deoxy-L-arabinose transferase-like glycosyltransferase